MPSEGAPNDGPSAEEGAQPAAAAGPPSMADRLGGAHIDLRADLEVSRHVFRGEAHYVLRDPVSFGSHRFSLQNYRILTFLRSDRSLAETFEALVAEGVLETRDSERFYAFILYLHKLCFLQLPISDEKALYERFESRRRAKRLQWMKSILFFRVPLLQPDAWLGRALPYVRPFFTRWAFGLWLATLTLAIYVVARNWTEFREPVGDIFRHENLPLLWISLIGLKVFHELGHAFATKLLGGRVPEMGAFFMVLTPCAYVDASAAWGFSRKRDRIIVCLAGMYVELFLAALCLFAWSVMEPGLWRSVMHNAIMLASVITIGFNINPLMRYDGYYALSDAVEIPNLRARAQQEGTDLLKRLLLGVRPVQPAGAQEGPGVRAFLVAFGLAGAIYKVTLVLGISTLVAMKFPVVGLLMGGLYLGGEVVGIVRRCLPYLWRSEETAPVRAWAMTLSLLLLVGLPGLLLALPVPRAVTTEAVLSGELEVVLRASAPGFVEELPWRAGQAVSAGQPVLRLRDAGSGARLREARARLAAARVALAHARGGDPGEVRKQEGLVRQFEAELDDRERQLAELELVAPFDGLLTDYLQQEERGRHAERGEPLATLVGGDVVVRALLSQEEFSGALPWPGQRVEFRSVAEPGRCLVGTVRRVAPSGRRRLDQSFARWLDPAEYAVHPVTGLATRSQFEIEVRLDRTEPTLPRLHGLRGRLRLEAQPEPLGARFVRRARTFLRRLSA